MNSLLQFYHYVNTELADARTTDWAGVSSPIPIIIISFSYLYFVLKCGPRYMENREPYSCLRFIKFYNIFQIVANACVVYHIIENGWYHDYWFKCKGLEYSTDQKSMKFASITWYFMCLKLIDYTETVLFVLRKKQRQVTFLHLYHHVSLVLLIWYQTKYYANPQTMSGVIVNAGIHVIMYTYYLLASMGPKIQRYTNYIKPTITRLQMIQFVYIAIYTIVFVVVCKAPKTPSVILVFLVITNFALFYNFYKKTYRTEKKEK